MLHFWIREGWIYAKRFEIFAMTVVVVSIAALQMLSRQLTMQCHDAHNEA